MVTQRAILRFLGDNGRGDNSVASVQMDGTGMDETKIEAFATAIGAHTKCNIAGWSLVYAETNDAVKPASGANVDRKAVIFFRDVTTGKTGKIELPAPESADLEEVAEGTRVTSAALAAIIPAIETLTGRTLVPVYGKVKQRF